MDSTNEIKDVIGTKRAPRKKAESAVKPAVMDETIKSSDETIKSSDETIAISKNASATAETSVIKDCEKESVFPGCNTCRNFGSYPAWQPCCDCRHNPKNQNSFYHS